MSKKRYRSLVLGKDFIRKPQNTDNYKKTTHHSAIIGNKISESKTNFSIPSKKAGL